MTDGPVMPLHMRRAEFDPVDELADVRQNEGVRPVVTALGLPAYLVTRYDDVREVLSDSTRFSNAGRRFFGWPDGCQVSDELARMRAGQLSAFDRPNTPGCDACSRPNSRCAGCAGWNRGLSRSSMPT